MGARRFTIQPCRGAAGCGAELAHRLSYLRGHRQQLCGRGFGVCHTFVPLRCRSASSWTGNGWLGEPCSYRQLREGTGSERCHIPFWGTYEPCLFFHRRTTRAFHLTQLRVCKTSEVVAADCLILWGQCKNQGQGPQVQPLKTSKS